MKRATKRKNRTPDQEAAKVARSIGLAPEQIRRGVSLAQVSNWTEGDQRKMIRSGETRTVRKRTRVERLRSAGTIEPHEAAACEAYANWHALGYDTIGCTANYEGAGGGGFRSEDLLARYRAQGEARESYQFARQALPPMFLPMFEAIVLEGRAISEAGIGLYGQLSRSQKCAKLTAAFRLSANVLHGRIAHCLAIE